MFDYLIGWTSYHNVLIPRRQHTYTCSKIYLQNYNSFYNLKKNTGLPIYSNNATFVSPFLYRSLSIMMPANTL